MPLTDILVHLDASDANTLYRIDDCTGIVTTDGDDVGCWKDKSFHGNEHFIGMDFAEPAIDVSKLAEGFGVGALRAKTPDEFTAAMDEALAADGPVLIETFVEAHV